MKKYKSFLNHKIVFRCDAANIPEIGSGHVYRSLVIAKFLKTKLSLDPKLIAFIVKTKGKYSKNLTILRKHKFEIIRIKSTIKDYSTEEAKELNKLRANMIIIDRLGKVNKNFYESIKTNFKKKIIIDDSSIHRKLFDLSLNPLIQNVPTFKGEKVGYKYLILDISKNTKPKIKKNNKNIFLFFGGFDSKNLTQKVINSLNLIKIKFNIHLPLAYKSSVKIKKNQHNFNFFKPEKYFNQLNKSNISIISGGIALFDSILNKKKIICIPQYEHQELNAKKILKTKAINYLNSKNKNFDVNLINLILKIYKDKHYLKKINAIQRRIIDIKKVKNTLELFLKTYAKSKN